MSSTDVLGEKVVIAELFNGFGHDSGGKLEIHRAVALRHVAEKKHSSVLLASAWYGRHPTFIPGMTKSGGG